MATFAIQQGKEDDDLWDPISKDLDREPSDVFNDMVNLTQEGNSDFLCTLTVIGETAEMHSAVRKCGYKVVSISQLPNEYKDELTSLGEKGLHVRIEVCEASIRHAVAAARKRLSAVMGLVSLYANPGDLRLHPKVIVYHHGSSRVFVQTEQAFRRLHPRRNPRDDISQILAHQKRHKVDRRVLAAIEQLALASGSSDTRTRLVSLWAALETLAGAYEGNATLDRVCGLIVPLVISRQVHRRTRYLTLLVQRFAGATGNWDYGTGLRTNKRRMARQDDMLTLLTSPEDSQGIVELLKFADHPLLRFRIHDTWKVFHDPKQMHQSLTRSCNRLQWQLARIYRARNLLVHEGEEVPHIVPLLDNLQNYLSMLVQRIVHELKIHPDWSLRAIIEYWNGRMTHVLKNLQRSPECLNCRDFLEKGDHAKLWSAAK